MKLGREPKRGPAASENGEAAGGGEVAAVSTGGAAVGAAVDGRGGRAMSIASALSLRAKSKCRVVCVRQ